MVDLNLKDLSAPALSSAAEAPSGPGREAPARLSERKPSAADSNEGPAEAREGHKPSEAARLLGIRDSSGDRLDVRVDQRDGVIVRIVDEQGNVIRQIPPEELLALARRLDEAIGLIFDTKR